MAISSLLVPEHEIAALRRALKDGATILRKYSWGAMTGRVKAGGRTRQCVPNPPLLVP